MDRFFDILRKTLVATITLVFAFAVVYVPQPPETAQAQGVGGAVTIIGGPGSIAAGVSATANSLVAEKESMLDMIANQLAKTMISNILQSMVTWINSGFKGSPAFIQDLDRFLLDVADETAGEYIKTLGEVGSFICEPFRLDIQLALAVKYQKSRERRQDSCTLSGIVGNVEKFFNNQVDRKDFWKQWVEVTSKPERYTPYGQFMAADAELNARLVNRKGQELEIAKMGDGFLSSKICETIEGPDAPVPEAVRRAEEQLKPTQTSDINDLKLPPLPTFPDPTTGAMRTPTDSGLANAATDSNQETLALAPTGLLAQAQTNTPTGATTVKARQRCVISTPGKVISEQINKALGAGQDSLVAADEINEVISALLGQIANQALTGAAGLLGLSVRSGGSGGEYGSYVDELVRDSYNQSGSFIERGYDQTLAKLQAQEDYNKMAVFYIPKLKEVINAPATALIFKGLTTNEIADLKGRAEISYDDAIYVRDNTVKHIAKLKPIITEFDALQKELLLTTTTDTRKQAIRTRQAQLINDGSSYSAYTQERLRASSREWGIITGS